jgi:catechol 2,3-dioxygenase-like lactoylglutathione lyase family enzyme
VFDHVTIRASARAASQHFYETVLRRLDTPVPQLGEEYLEWADFSVAQATEEKPPTRRLHVGFVAPSREHVDAFWRAGTTAGYRSDGEPGRRPQYRDDYYGAFLLDPDGNSVEAVHHGALRDGGIVDHLWIRVADVAAAKRFYETVAPIAGFRLAHDTAERAQFVGGSGSFSLVAGEPAEEVHLAFPAPDSAAVDSFHEALTGAGYRSNGEAGERPEYHSGYYAAFVLDPDGNNVEVVHHDR